MGVLISPCTRSRQAGAVYVVYVDRQFIPSRLFDEISTERSSLNQQVPNIEEIILIG